jgi:hypothetical protein
VTRRVPAAIRMSVRRGQKNRGSGSTDPHHLLAFFWASAGDPWGYRGFWVHSDSTLITYSAADYVLLGPLVAAP